ncbi:hypothetical protein J4422_03750 [Candidatus Pacearchaeota archaeon]|nr:hypothetical protein [Candidatus Pacearchaeota archaeon]
MGNGVTRADIEASQKMDEMLARQKALTAPSQNRNIEYTEGDILAKYELGEQLANTENGGQGGVFRAKRREDGLDAVVKVYSAKETGSWEAIFHEEKRAGREIGFLKRANADGVSGLPILLECGTTGSFIKSPVAVFESFPGKKLEEEVADPTYTPSLEKTWEVVGGLREPLEYAHTKNGAKPITHKDINPGNILVNGTPILIDWASSSNPSTGRTLIRTQMYTKYFTAPEVSEGEESDVRADIYSLGKVAQFMLLGKDLFEASDGIPSEKDFETLNVPKGVVKVLQKATQEKPENRYRNVLEFYDAFDAAIRNLPIPPEKRADQYPQIAAKAKSIYKLGEERVRILIPNIAREVGGYQIGVFTLANIAREVGGDQRGLFSGLNIAREVGRDQVALGMLANIAGEVGKGQGGTNLINIARKIGEHQSGGILNITGEIGKSRSDSLERKVGTQIGLINYAGRGNVNQYGLINIRGSGPWYKRVSLFFGRMREAEETTSSSGSFGSYTGYINEPKLPKYSSKKLLGYVNENELIKKNFYKNLEDKIK